MSLVLIADTAEAGVFLKGILQGQELVVTHTMKEALAKLQEQVFDLLIVGLHFEESEMFEFMRAAKASSPNHVKPLVYFCAHETAMPQLMHNILETSSRAVGNLM